MPRASFVIDGTELGIDRASSHFRVIDAGTRQRRLDAKIVGPEGLTVRGVVCLQGGRLPFAIVLGTL